MLRTKAQPQPDHGLMTSLPISLPLRALRVLVTAAAVLTGAASAFGQAGGGDPSPGFLDGLFGGGAPAPGAHRDRLAQSSAGELSMRVDRLESQIRQMTGVIEQLQYRNQQLADQLRRLQEDPVAQQSSAEPPRPTGVQTGVQTGAPVGAPAVTRPPPIPPAPGGRRGDAFDPTQNPSAPGAPRTLGGLPGGGGVAAPNQPPEPLAAEQPPIGAPGGRVAGEPLNLSTMGGNVGPDPGFAPPAEGRNPAGGGQVATLPPSDSPKDYYDLAYGYILRRDYALAEDGFRSFLRKFPSDRMAPEAQYWLGESLFQRQRYRDAAEAFLNVSTKYESTAKAPDALLRLGQSLAVLGEKEAACASLGEVLRKYPRAALGVKQGVDREQKRVGC
jgi:tol-pal system protein YbgF